MATVYGTATLTSTSTLTAAGTIAGVGTVLNPIETSSPASVDFATGVVAALPEPQAGDPGSHDLWYRLESDVANTLTLTWTGSFDVAFEAWVAPPTDEVASVDDLTLMEFGNGPTLVVATGEEQVYFIRIRPLDDANNAGTGTLTWAFVPRPEGFINLLCDPIAYDAPSWLSVSVTSATEEGEVSFAIDGVDVFTDFADDAGSIVEASIPVVDLAAGTHTITATDVESGEIDAEDFELVLYANNSASPLPPLMPTTPSSEEPVIRWVFEDFLPVYNPDPMAGQESYTFPNNPSSMSTPHAGRVINPDHTTAPDGQAILTEGAVIPTEWTWEGFCFTQEHFDALEHWHANQRRFWVVDHLQRAWVVTFETLEWSYVKDTQHPWAQRYRAKCFIYAGPVFIADLP